MIEQFSEYELKKCTTTELKKNTHSTNREACKVPKTEHRVEESESIERTIRLTKGSLILEKEGGKAYSSLANYFHLIIANLTDISRVTSLEAAR